MASKLNPFVNAILYADLFDFPLTEDELWRYAISSKKGNKEDLGTFIKQLPSAVVKKSGFFYLSDRDLAPHRKRKTAIGRRKLVIAKKVAGIIAKIPTVFFVGVSGGLSLLNTEELDDIDLFIITKKGTAWMTRLFVTVLLELSGVRRRRNDTLHISDKICVNMYLDEAKMKLSEKRHDLYTAHEVIQLLPLVERANTYEKFINANLWVKRFLPNGLETQKTPQRLPEKSLFSTFFLFPGLERILRSIQMWYMKRHRTREDVSATLLAFHPIDYRKRTLAAFATRLKDYEKV